MSSGRQGVKEGGSRKGEGGEGGIRESDGGDEVRAAASPARTPEEAGDEGEGVRPEPQGGLLLKL